MRLLIGGSPTGTLKHITPEQYAVHCGGLLSWADGTSPASIAALGAPWAMDNFAFTSFDGDAFIAYMDACLPYQHSCKWVVAPDVWSNSAATLSLFEEWHGRIRERGYNVALAAQDGLEYLPIPWDELDCLFVGGSDGWRISAAMPALVREALRRGKTTHWGRVNSVSRMTLARQIGFDSCDGSSYARIRRKVLEVMPLLQKTNVPPMQERMF